MGLLARLTGKSRARAESTTTKKKSSAYRAVEVVPGAEGCCQAAQEIAGQRYLSHQVPRLPLEKCDRTNCLCSYQLYDDRRMDARRASDIGYDLASELRTAENRRAVDGGRRMQDD